MKHFLLLTLLVAITVVAGTGCCQHSGSREFIPGKGWVPND